MTLVTFVAVSSESAIKEAQAFCTWAKDLDAICIWQDLVQVGSIWCDLATVTTMSKRHCHVVAVFLHVISLSLSLQCLCSGISLYIAGFKSFQTVEIPLENGGVGGWEPKCRGTHPPPQNGWRLLTKKGFGRRFQDKQKLYNL